MKQILVLLMLLCSISILAQDVIVKKNGSTVLCRIVEVNSSEVVYKRWTNLKGANYIMDRADVTAINYENGKKDLLSEPGLNQYAPSNQNTGQQHMNDNALLMHYNKQNYEKKIIRLKKTGFIGGAILGGAGILFMTCNKLFDSEDSATGLTVGFSCIGAAAVWTGSFLYSANRCKKAAESMVLSTSIWQNEIKLKEGKSLLTGVNILKDNINKTNSFGISLSCNF